MILLLASQRSSAYPICFAQDGLAHATSSAYLDTAGIALHAIRRNRSRRPNARRRSTLFAGVLQHTRGVERTATFAGSFGPRRASSFKTDSETTGHAESGPPPHVGEPIAELVLSFGAGRQYELDRSTGISYSTHVIPNDPRWRSPEVKSGADRTRIGPK